MRVLVTGSRKWTDRLAVYRILNDVCREFALEHEPDQYGNTMADPGRITVVEGGCPSGPDFFADQWCISNCFTSEKHPADWAKYGKRAGYVRNAEMVALGADLCLAFIQDDSSGASMTAALAQKAGIPTRIYRRGEGA